MEQPHGSLVIFHLPERAFLGIIYWNFCPVCCKHSHSNRPPLCRLPFINTEEALSNMSYGAVMKDSLCELKRSPVPECLPHWVWPDSDSCCLDNFVDFCAFSAHLADQNLFGCFFKVFLWNGLWSAFTRKWYITSVTFQEESKTAFMWVVNVFCLFLTSEMHLKVSSMPVHQSLGLALLINHQKWRSCFSVVCFCGSLVFICTWSICSILSLFNHHSFSFIVFCQSFLSEVWYTCCNLLPSTL